jgi:RHS repeat-associated protein
MLSPTGWWLVTAPMDLRRGMDRLLVHVRESLKLQGQVHFLKLQGQVHFLELRQTSGSGHFLELRPSAIPQGNEASGWEAIRRRRPMVARPITNRSPAGYTGQYEDPLTDLTYMQARYYDGDLGVFLSIDPLSTTLDNLLNFGRYAYASANPLSFIDPAGMAACSPSASYPDQNGQAVTNHALNTGPHSFSDACWPTRRHQQPHGLRFSSCRILLPEAQGGFSPESV